MHEVAGRVRLKVPEHYTDEGEAMAARLRGASGVHAVRWSSASRSLVVDFEPALSFQQVLEHLPPEPPRRPARRPVPAEQAPPGPWWRMLLTPAISLTAGLLGLGPASAVAIAVSAVPIARRAIRSLGHRHVSIDLLDATAVSLLLGTGDLLAAGVSVALIESGERLRRQASGRASTVFRYWMGGDDRGVRLARSGTEPRVPSDMVALGDHAVVYAGETIPVDGRVIAGTASVDNRTWTGEPYPVAVEPGSNVLAGATVLDGRIVVEVTATGDDTRAGLLATAIEEALAANTRTTDMARRIADRFVIPVLAGSALVYAVTGELGRVVSMLIVDFGTGIRVAVPTSFLSTMIGGARHQILFKHGRAIEALAKVDTVVFDKTGTLTTGRPAVVGVDTAPGVDEATALRFAAAAEGHLPHPIARAIRRYARSRGLSLPSPTDVTVAAGGGICAEIEGHRVEVGRRGYLEAAGVALPPPTEGDASQAVVAIDGTYAARLHIRDGIRSESQTVIADLRAAGISSIWLATGDREAVANRVASRLQLDEVRARLMPEDKVKLVRELCREGRSVAVVGDGINDAGAMAEATVGVAMARGADLTRASADVLLGAEDLDLLVQAVQLARFAMTVVRQDIVLIAAPNAVALGAATAGVLPPLAATLVNNGTTLLAGVNSLRPLRR